MKKIKVIDLTIYLFIGAVVTTILGSIFNWVNKDGIKIFETTSPLIYPFLIGAAMFIFLVSTIISDLRNISKEETSKEHKGELAHDVLMAAVYAGGVLIYSIVVPKLGFIVGTIVFLVITMMIMNYEELNLGKKALKAVVISSATVPVLHFVFYEIFKVMLP